MDFLTLIQVLDSTIRLTTPLLLACLAGLYSERAGIFDIGLEGKMLAAAFLSAAVAYVTGSVWLGLLAGIAILEFGGPLLPDESGMLAAPSIDLEIGIAAAGILVVTGMIAGLIPARAAVRIHPVDAFRAE